MNSKNTYISGLHAVTSLLTIHPERIRRLYVLSGRSDQRMQTVLDMAATANIPIETASRAALDELSPVGQHQGIIAECHPPKSFSEADLIPLIERSETPPFLLVLDGVQDPHNLGACLRSADAAGVTAVIAPKDRSVSLTETAIRVASGAAESVPFVQVTNLARTLALLKKMNIWVYGAAAEAKKTLYQEKLTGSVALVLGAEGSGLRRLTITHCDELLKIPLQGMVSSLNVSVAAGIFMFEVVRQRQGG